MNDGPLIVQSDKTILLEVDHELATRHAERFHQARDLGGEVGTGPPPGVAQGRGCRHVLDTQDFQATLKVGHRGFRTLEALQFGLHFGVALRRSPLGPLVLRKEQPLIRLVLDGLQALELLLQ